MRKSNSLCSVCGEPIYRRPSELRRFKAVYCSQKCYRVIESRPTKVCKSCEKSFLPNKPSGTFCSHSCANNARRNTTYSKLRFINRSQERISILKSLFNFQCCMVEGCNYCKTYDIHRLITGRNGGKYEIGNMFAICPNHHAEVTRGLIVLDKVTNSILKVISNGG